MKQRNYFYSRGITLIEITVVMLVIGIAVAVAAPSLTRALQTYRLNSGAQQIADAFQLARFAAVRSNSAQSVFFNTSNNSLAVGQTTAATATLLPPGVRFASPTVAAPAIVANAAANAGTIAGQQSNAQAAISFPTVTGQTNFHQAAFTSRGLPQVTPGAVNWVYLTNTRNELAAVTITSAGSTRIWRWNPTSSQWE